MSRWMTTSFSDRWVTLSQNKLWILHSNHFLSDDDGDDGHGPQRKKSVINLEKRAKENRSKRLRHSSIQEPAFMANHLAQSRAGRSILKQTARQEALEVMPFPKTEPNYTSLLCSDTLLCLSVLCPMTCRFLVLSSLNCRGSPHAPH